jgi:hypothetical protein
MKIQNKKKNPTHKHYYSKTQNLQDTYHHPTANALFKKTYMEPMKDNDKDQPTMNTEAY